MIGSDPPKAADIKAGDATVSTQTGDLSWAYPIAVPPGRNGVAPSLSLGYSSQASTYGGIAAGFAWNLGIPVIREDTSESHLKRHSPLVELFQQSPGEDDRFIGLNGRRLIPVDETRGSDVYMSYRAQGDASFLRYERLSQGSAYWRVLSTDGSVMEFGGPTAACLNKSDGYAPLTRTADVFGNEILYSYEEVITGECRLKSIEWGSNSAASLSSFAKVEMVWGLPGLPAPPMCNGIPVGSQTDYRTGTKIVTGASLLHQIRVTAFEPGQPTAPVHTREITLGYSSTDWACNLSHAPLKLLTSIQESAWITGGTHVNLPAITLEYGDRTVAFGTSVAEQRPWGDVTGTSNNLGWGYRYPYASTDTVDRSPTVEAMFVDLDGDGLVDRLVNSSWETNDGVCRAEWQRNQGPASGSTSLASFAAPQQIILPRLKWHGLPLGQDPPPAAGGSVASAARGEKCSLAGQVTAFWNSSNAPYCHDGTPGGGTLCHAANDPDDPNMYCDPNGRECPTTSPAPDPRTYLHYRWLDADGDGLTDLVAAVHGDIRTYDIEQGNDPLASPPSAEPLLFGPWPACPSEPQHCLDVDPGCVARAYPNFAAVQQCIDNAPVVGCDALIKDPYGTPSSINRGPYTRCEGLYPWFIFKNLGNGTFDDPVIKYQPIPLESNSGDSNLGGNYMLSQREGIIDVDGDGILDAVVTQTGGMYWWVWFGDGTGGFEPTRYMFFTHPNELLSETGSQVESGGCEESDPDVIGTVADEAGLFDLNGDSAADYWQTITAQGNAVVYFNNGYAHSSTDFVETPYSGSYAVAPGNNTTHNITKCDYVDPNPPAEPGEQWSFFEGTTFSRNRVFDVDDDGRSDVVQDVTGSPKVFFNLGGQFSAPPVNLPYVSGNPPNVGGLKRLTSVSGNAIGDPGIWKLLGDHIDLDGDGVAEVVSFETGSYKRAHQQNADPPRLLTAVHNGRGAHTTIQYASMHDTSTVTQDPESYWTDHWGRQHPNASPRTQWVVNALTTTDDFSNTTSTASYLYKNPRHGPDDEGKYSFRGFEEVTTTAPSGAKTVERFGYDVDWSGRLVETVVMPVESEMIMADEVRSMTRTTWEERTLFSGTIHTYHATETEQFTCNEHQDEPTCIGAPTGHSQTTTTLEALVPDGGTDPLFWMPRSSVLHGDGPIGDGPDRQTESTYVFKSAPGMYRLRPLTTEKRVANGASMDLYAKNAVTWGPDYKVKVTEEVWVDTNDNNRAITHYEYDMATGNLKKRWKPKQWAGNKFTEYFYDNRQLFIATEVNELGHQRDYTYEYGTGTKLMTEGPNERTCSGGGCPLDATHPLKEQHKVIIDGLGRTIETWDTVSDDGTLYELLQRSTTSYVDMPSGSTPMSVTSRVRLDTTSSTWTQETTELDGHGRPIKRTVDAQGSAPDNPVTIYTYRNDGTLAAVEVPDPTQNNAARVTYTYTFDSLGRPTSIRRPDASDPADQSGVDIFYYGSSTVTNQVVPAAAGGGKGASSWLLRDSFGRLRTSVELLDGFFEMAMTTYDYDPNDNVVSIVDPEGVTTTMKHDFAAHRTEIARHGRTWKYTYDLNGNLESELVPGSPNPPVTDIDYTTFIVYDDLDRPVSKVIGQRSLSSADQDLFADATESFEWDIGGNMIGQLRYWRSFAPGASTAAIVNSTRFNNQGQLITTIQNLEIADYPELERRFGRRYYLFGGVSETRFEDQLGGTNKTIANTYYDARALPTHMVLKRTGMSDQTLASDTRNVAGLVTVRHTTTPGGLLDSLWSYDTLGRVSNQNVQILQAGAQVPIVRQDLSYYANDNPKTLTHYLGATPQTFNFSYDTRQQLRTVAAVTTGYFNAAYDYGDGGRLEHASESQTIDPLPEGTAVKPRDVNYVYGDADPERLTALTNVSDGSIYAGYSYDEAGNMTTRCYGGTGVPTCAGESVDFVYDGKDQLRRATKKLNGIVQGSEEYWYDGTGQRVAVVKRDAAGDKTEMIWFIGETEAHYDGTGNITHIYSHLSLGTSVARVDRTANTSTSVEYQFHGLASNMIAAVAEDGNVSASFTYAPFGEVIEAGGGSAGPAAHKRRLNDKYEDDLTSLAYYGARYYDKNAMMWTQSDPLYRYVPDLAKSATPRRANLYQFSLSNPLTYLDPDGRDTRPTYNPANTCPLCDGNPAVIKSQAAQKQEAQNDARDLILCLFNLDGCKMKGRDPKGRKGLQVGFLDSVPDNLGRWGKLNRSGSKQLMAAAVGLLMDSLSKSESFRNLVSDLLVANVNADVVFVNHGESGTYQRLDDGHVRSFVGLDDRPLVWQANNGIATYSAQSAVNGLAHELFHNWDYSTQRRGFSVWQAERVRLELRATEFENTFRFESGQGPRLCYYCDEVTGPCNECGPLPK